jgi:K+-transporting ATPase ATPase C chain
MWKDLRASLAVLIVLTAVTGLAYPAVVAAIARLAFPWQAEGSLIVKNGQVVGSALIGQSFTRAGYFQGRPSATTAPDPADPSKSVPAAYNAAASVASNLAPSAQALADIVADRRSALLAAQPGQAEPIPADLLTASASGLDPHISPAAAEWQVKRVAAARQVSADDIRRLVSDATQGRDLGILGEPRVNVLVLNLALDARWPIK